MKTIDSDILLQTGTNELEIILFELGNESYATNVLKVREIITQIPITRIPNSHPAVEGLINVRGEIIPLINLASILNTKSLESPENHLFIIMELNQIKIALRVDKVKRISRISWEQIEKPNELSAGDQPYATGVIKQGQELSVLLDIEKVVVEINPELGGSADSIKELGPRERSAKKIIIAEDSSVLRSLLKDTLNQAGYENTTFFQNGREAWDYLESLAENETINPYEHVQLLLTDIEMPQMDGHHLTYRVKKHSRLKDIPVIIFSSLITEDLFHKGESVGAAAQISKPQLVELVKEIDKYIL